MTKNRQIAEFIFSKMEEFGYKPYDIDYGNGYFLFDYGDDSVIHFRCKGVWKHWKFGMWIFSEYLDLDDEKKDKYPMIEIFAQYDTQIDKFKPSRSELCVSFNASSWDESKKNNGLLLYSLESMLGMMKRHPFICYDGLCGDGYVGYRTYSFIWNFIKYEGKHYRRDAKKKIKTAIFVPYTKTKIFFAKRDKCVKNIEFYNFEKENPGWRTDYLYSVNVTFAKDSDDDKEIAWLNKWFKKDKYGEFDYYDHVIKLNPLRREGLEGEYGYIKD